MEKMYKKGKFITIFENHSYNVYRYHSYYTKTHFNVYSNFDMSSEHNHILAYDIVVSNRELIDLLREDEKDITLDKDDYTMLYNFVLKLSNLDARKYATYCMLHIFYGYLYIKHTDVDYSLDREKLDAYLRTYNLKIKEHLVTGSIDDIIKYIYDTVPLYSEYDETQLEATNMLKFLEIPLGEDNVI